jgi:hypothetical protein
MIQHWGLGCDDNTWHGSHQFIAYIGTLDMENESHMFFYSPIHGSLQIVYLNFFFWQILEDGATNQTFQYEISHMCATCKPH